MYRNNPYDFSRQNHTRSRYMQSLFEQLKADHAECRCLWKMFENDGFKMSGTDDIIRVLSWIQTEITVLKELSKDGVEGVAWGGIKDIEDDIRNKKMYLKTFCFVEKIKTT